MGDGKSLCILHVMLYLDMSLADGSDFACSFIYVKNQTSAYVLQNFNIQPWCEHHISSFFCLSCHE